MSFRTMYIILFIILLTLFGCENHKGYSEVEKSLISQNKLNLWSINPEFEVLSNGKKKLVWVTNLVSSGGLSECENVFNEKVFTDLMQHNNLEMVVLFLDVNYKLKKTDKFTISERNRKFLSTIFEDANQIPTDAVFILDNENKIQGKPLTLEKCSEFKKQVLEKIVQL